MSVLRRIASRLGHRRWFAAAARPLVPADRFLGRLTRGRLVALGLVPSLIITTIGRRSGRPRSNPLLYVRDGDAYAVVGSNWGRAAHPAWALNLLADPRATVAVRGQVIAVRARVVTGPDRDRLWGLLVRQWPPYESYAERARRDIPLFRLEPGDRPPTPG
ncbi:MAG TPA: nitroreductase/quinone reductase family protein [Micromonosporaceae bacterium]|nr:nitroreductase/quinone reductase family protein [Micromonosporaceae bacterium]